MATSGQSLDFEKPIVELERQIDELKRLAGGQQLSVEDEIAPLEQKLVELRDQIYHNLSPWQRVQVARNVKRPFTSELIQLIFTDFIELHGDVGAEQRLDLDRALGREFHHRAVEVGADGIIVESHPSPEEALCDGPQQIPTAEFGEFAREVRAIVELLGKTIG